MTCILDFTPPAYASQVLDTSDSSVIAVAVTHIEGQRLPMYRGRYWAGVRAACEPVFHSDKLQTYVPIANKALSSLVNKLAAVQSQGPVQINLALAGMTMDVIGGSAFG